MSVNEEEVKIGYLCEMAVGATLLKYGRSGNSHFRKFQLSNDLTRLTWESARTSNAAVLFSQITELKLGQKTQIFEKNPLPSHESLSFSLMHSGRSLDIVCKDRKEFEVWTNGIKLLLENRDKEKDLKKAVDAHLQRQKRKTTDRFTVSVGTLRTQVVINENACQLYTWGYGSRGMLGHKEEYNERLPRVVESLLGRDISMTSCGVAHTMAVSANGEVFSWGSGKFGRLGHGHMRDRFSPLMIGVPLREKPVTLVACNEFHSVAVCESGELFTWGRGGPYLGYKVEGGGKHQLSPRAVEGLGETTRVTGAACGVGHTLVFTDKGIAFSFGDNKFGELGLGHNNSMFTPTRVNGIFGVTKVACGLHHSAAIASEGRLWMWGWGERGQLGQGDQKSYNIPKMLLFGNGVVDINCGHAHNCALTDKFAAYCWGDNSAFQLGYSLSVSEASKPKSLAVPPGVLLIKVACGANFTVALTHSGRVFTWGYGANGQLGHGDNKTKAHPTEVEALSDKQVQLVSCGAEHMACLVVHGWVPDDEAKSCMACKKNFTTIRRRHHCRQCGGLFCGACSAKKFPLLDKGYSDAVRVCDRCYTDLSRDR